MLNCMKNHQEQKPSLITCEHASSGTMCHSYAWAISTASNYKKMARQHQENFNETQKMVISYILRTLSKNNTKAVTLQ